MTAPPWSLFLCWKAINVLILAHSGIGYSSDDTKMSVRNRDNTITIRKEECFTKNVDSVGNDIDIKIGSSSNPIQDPEACQQLCQERDGCMYFMYGKGFDVPNLGKRDVCWLKSEKTSLTPYNGLVFGPKHCSDCCQLLKVSASDKKLNSKIFGKYEYIRQYKEAPAYKRIRSPNMYLFWDGNRWVMWRVLGQNFYCEPWWAFWNCREVYGWIRYDDTYKCPEKIQPLWKSVFTQSVDPGIDVRCHDDNSPTPATTTSSPDPGFSCGIKHTRIVGGSEAGPYSLPWQVGLVRKTRSNRKPFCGGTLISNRHVLTAAHCTRAIKSFDVVVGEHNTADSSDGTIHSVSKIVEHHDYTGNPPNYDFAIVTLRTPISPNARANAACLPTSNWSGEFLAGKRLTVSGWGITSQGSTSAVLHRVEVSGLTNPQCNKLYDNRITPAMLCAGNVDNGGVDSCQGDSGGPLTYSHNGGPTTVVGVVSWGIGCGQKTRPGVYSRVTSALKWIKRNMK